MKDKEFQWDELKNRKNIHQRGLGFDDAITMLHGEVLIIEDTRKDYGEIRKRGLGYLERRLMFVVFTEREPNIIRIISFRRANKREQAYYNKKITNRLDED